MYEIKIKRNSNTIHVKSKKTTLRVVSVGKRGAQGATGLQGPQGIQGEQGLQGPAGINTWGSIDGLLSAQIDLQNELNSKAAIDHIHVLDDLGDVAISAPLVGDVLTYTAEGWVSAQPTGGGGGSGTDISYTVTQAAHGFAVGDVLRSSGVDNTYAKAQADSAINAEAVGFASEVVDANSFKITSNGIITTGVPAEAAGTVLFLSPSTPGALTTTEPTDVGDISKPLGIILESGQKMLFANYRGEELTTASTGGGGGSPLTVAEIDGTPSVANVTEILVANGTLTNNGGGSVTIDTGAGGGGGGSGDVVGPSSAVNNNVAFFNGTTGKLIKDSGLTLSGSNTGDQDLSTLTTGAASSTDNALPRFDGVGGKNIQNSGVIIDDSNNISGIGAISSGAITQSGAALDVTYAPIAKGVTNGDSHDHNGGDGAQINHTTLSNIGTNTHAQIDTHIAATGTSAHGDSYLLNTGDSGSGAYVFTASLGSNIVPVTIVQNDTTNDKQALIITSAANSGSNNALDLTTANGYAARFDGGDLYIKLGATSPYVPNGGGIVIEPYNGTTAGDTRPYARLMFNPEKKAVSPNNPPDVILSAHKYHENGELHEHLSLYTSDASSVPQHRLDIEYLQDQAAWNIDNSTIEITSTATTKGLFIHSTTTQLAADEQLVKIDWNANNTNANNSAFYVYSNFSHTNTNAVNTIVRFRNDAATSVAGLLHLDQDGGGRVIDITNTANGADFVTTHTTTNKNWANGSIQATLSHVVSDGSTYVHTGSMLKISSSATLTSGSITDSANLALFQQLYTSASGTVVDIDNRGSGKSIAIRNNATEYFSISSAGIVTISTFSGVLKASTGAVSGSATLNDLGAPTADFSMNSHRITSVTDPASAQDVATKNYVDSVAQGLDAKASCRVATTTNITLSGTQTIDGVGVIVGDRVLVKNQSTASQNGIYDVAAGAWSRSIDTDSDAEVTTGLFTFITAGATQANTGWVLTTSGVIVVGTTPLSFSQFSATSDIVAGAGLIKTGTTIDVVGTTNRITVAADSIDISSSYIGQASITTLGTITTGVWNGTDIAIADGGTGASTASGARTNLGLGTIATQDANTVSITGGSVTGITDLAVADGGTGASDATTARANLGLGSMSIQSASAVTITGGSIVGITDITILDGGTGASDKGTAFNNLAPTTTEGDMIYLNSSANNVRLPKGTAKQFLQMNTGATAPSWTTPFVNAVVASNVTTTLATAANVTNMGFAIIANETWSFEIYLQTGCSGTGGTKYAITVPTGATFRVVAVGMSSAITTLTSAIITVSGTLTTIVFNNVALSTGWMRIVGTCVNGANSGNVQLQFASTTAGQTSTVFANSYITARKH